MKQKKIQSIVKQFASETVKELGNQLVEIIWYGSTARGKGSKHSDIDILLLMKDKDRSLRRRAVDISARLSLQHDCLIAVSLMSLNRYRQMLENGRLYAKNIEQEGVRLWKKEV